MKQGQNPFTYLEVNLGSAQRSSMTVCKYVFGVGRFVAADATEFCFYLLH